MTDWMDDEYGRLFRTEGDRLWRAVYAFSHDTEIASDAVAEAFAQCIGRGDKVQKPQRWIWRAAFKIAAGELEARSRWAELKGDPPVEMPEDGGEVVLTLRALSPHQRAAVILTDYAGYDAKAVGEMLDCSPATARVHLSRGRRRLRSLLEDENG
jgi:RNA polymerase sigma-70 factor (ECF subfamily)